MDIRQITPRFFASPQIEPADMAALKEAGITLVLCNRPDEEVPPNLQHTAIKHAAEQAGIAFAFQPLTHQTMTPDVIAHNRDISVVRDETVLAYCASGTRSTIAWALGQAGDQSADDLIDAARAGGYDLSHLRGPLSTRYA
tara:strand:- start:2127 stop:2549 length:423 start_codon:yes stop_codon:yes gene_type:complete